MRGGKRQWGSGEERKWGHDKFEEMNTGEKHSDVKLLSMVFRIILDSSYLLIAITCTCDIC